MKPLFVDNCLTGPFRNEAEFKNAFIARCEAIAKKKKKRVSFFTLEDSEGNKGAPDAFCIYENGTVQFYEFKYVREDGNLRFQHDQPLWYKQHAHLNVSVVVWDSRYNRMFEVHPATIVAEKRLIIPFIVDMYDIDASVWED